MKQKLTPNEVRGVIEAAIAQRRSNRITLSEGRLTEIAEYSDKMRSSYLSAFPAEAQEEIKWDIEKRKDAARAAKELLAALKYLAYPGTVEQYDQLIAALKEIAAWHDPRPGRPPKWIDHYPFLMPLIEGVAEPPLNKTEQLKVFCGLVTAIHGRGPSVATVRTDVRRVKFFRKGFFTARPVLKVRKRKRQPKSASQKPRGN